MPSNNFCTKCGARLNPQQRFCTTCGASVGAPAANDGGAGVPVAPAPTAAMPAAPAATAAMPVVPAQPPVLNAPNAVPQYIGSAGQTVPTTAKPRKSKKTAIVITTLAVLAVAAVTMVVLFCTGALSFNDTGAKEADSAPTTAVQESPAASGETAEPATTDAEAPAASPESEASQAPAEGQAAEAATEAAPEAEPSREEAALYDKLTVLYDELGGFDQRISAAASDFNNFYASDDYALRAEYSADADALLYAIQEQYGELLGTNVPLNSVNAESYQALDTCYSDCVNRISVITEAWNISLSYDDPSYYRDEILEPIARDNDGTTNRYYADFQKTYPLAKPVKP